MYFIIQNTLYDSISKQCKKLNIRVCLSTTTPQDQLRYTGQNSTASTHTHTHTHTHRRTCSATVSLHQGEGSVKKNSREYGHVGVTSHM